jgi:hypothetical protein
MRFWFLMITSWPGSLVAERQQILCLAWTFSVYYTHWCLRCAALPLKKYDGPKVVDFKAELTRRGRLGEPCKNLDVICFSFKNVFVRFGM